MLKRSDFCFLYSYCPSECTKIRRDPGSGNILLLFVAVMLASNYYHVGIEADLHRQMQVYHVEL